MSLSQAARVFGCARNSLRSWSQRFLAEGRDGLADGAGGLPPKLDAAARALLETALTTSPLDYDYPVATWTVPTSPICSVATAGMSIRSRSIAP